VIELSLSNQWRTYCAAIADIAVRMVRPQQKALLAKRVGKLALGFHAHRRYLERYGYPERLQDLARHALIGFDRTLPFANLLKAVPLPVTRELFAFRATMIWRSWRRCVRDLESGFAKPALLAAIRTCCRFCANNSRSRWRSGSSCTTT